MEGIPIGLKSYIHETHCLSETGPILPFLGRQVSQKNQYFLKCCGSKKKKFPEFGEVCVQVQVFLSQKQTSVLIFELQS